MTSDRETDTFDNAAKQRYRDHNLTVIRATAALWEPDLRRLRCDVVDLMGGSWGKTIDTFGAVLRPNGMIFVDSNEGRICEAKAAYPEHTFIAGGLENKIGKLVREFNVGVLINDGYKEVDSTEATSFFTTVRPLIKRGVESFGSFILCSNNCLSTTYRRQREPEEALYAHTEAVLQGVRDYVVGRHFQFKDLLPAGFEKKIRDLDYEGPVGAYWLYRGKKTGVRMACLGLVM